MRSMTDDLPDSWWLFGQFDHQQISPIASAGKLWGLGCHLKLISLNGRHVKKMIYGHPMLFWHLTTIAASGSEGDWRKDEAGSWKCKKKMKKKEFLTRCWLTGQSSVLAVGRHPSHQHSPEEPTMRCNVSWIGRWGYEPACPPGTTPLNIRSPHPAKNIIWYQI